MEPSANLHEATVASFGGEWTDFDQSRLTSEELATLFEEYFRIFPWERLPPHAVGADLGCGSGRWARLVAPRVERLHLVDPSAEALASARRNLAGQANVQLHLGSLSRLPFAPDSLDFAYSLGVLHHVPDTAEAMASCVRVLKPGAPMLVYVYYAFDNRPAWYRALWRVSDALRRRIASMPPRAKRILCDACAAGIYWPLARLSALGARAGVDVDRMPLAAYRSRSFYTMRTDARDRFGTPLERRFEASELRSLMEAAGLVEIRFSDSPPYWCAVGLKRGGPR